MPGDATMKKALEWAHANGACACGEAGEHVELCPVACALGVPHPDEDGACSRCGCEFEDPAELTHACPAGFTERAAAPAADAVTPAADPKPIETHLLGALEDAARLIGSDPDAPSSSREAKAAIHRALRMLRAAHAEPSLYDLRGAAPNATGDVPSEVFVRRIRDGECGFCGAPRSAPAEPMVSVRRFVRRDYWSEGNRPYQNVRHDEHDQPVNSTMTDDEMCQHVADGDEFEITIRRTGRRPFGDRRYVLQKAHEYGPETDRQMRARLRAAAVAPERT